MMSFTQVVLPNNPLRRRGREGGAHRAPGEVGTLVDASFPHLTPALSAPGGGEGDSIEPIDVLDGAHS